MAEITLAGERFVATPLVFRQLREVLPRLLRLPTAPGPQDVTAGLLDDLAEIIVAALGADYFRYEEDRKTLVGERTGRRFTLGDKLAVRLTRVDPSERKMDFELVEQTAQAFHPRRTRTAKARRKSHGA
jgi:hypothetical protein